MLGLLSVGDLFSLKPHEIEQSLNSVRHMLKLRQEDLNFRREVRQKLDKHDQDQAATHRKMEKDQLRIETLQRKLEESVRSNQTAAQMAKEERAKILAEREDLIKRMGKIESKEV